MSAPATILVENLGKAYRVGHQTATGSGYRTFREEVGRWGRRLWERGATMLRGEQLLPGDTVEEFWALRDVSFSVRPGEVMGVIGRNGAGKSTLLKVLSRITEPTQGRVTLHGRVASLLEVGTGFHPELTGRENIYLNGAILGMARHEIARKFDEIVDFSGVERFLDTPVKRYSSGMYMRLAFAVAAHLEPEILVVDEVLAVGDLEFQKKCLGKMEEVSLREGRTVLFVSHQMSAIERLCQRALLLEQGRVVLQDTARIAVDAYLARQAQVSAATARLQTLADRSGTGAIRLREASFVHLGGQLRTGDPLTIRWTLENTTAAPIPQVSLGYSIFSERDAHLVNLYSHQVGQVWTLPPGRSMVEVAIPQLPLLPGEYAIDARVVCGELELDWPRYRLAQFRIEAGPYEVDPRSSARLALGESWRLLPGAR